MLHYFLTYFQFSNGGLLDFFRLIQDYMSNGFIAATRSASAVPLSAVPSPSPLAPSFRAQRGISRHQATQVRLMWEEILNF
jgi:hypothetical protein